MYDTSLLQTSTSMSYFSPMLVVAYQCVRPNTDKQASTTLTLTRSGVRLGLGRHTAPAAYSKNTARQTRAESWKTGV